MVLVSVVIFLIVSFSLSVLSTLLAVPHSPLILTGSPHHHQRLPLDEPGLTFERPLGFDLVKSMIATIADIVVCPLPALLIPLRLRSE